MSLTRTVSAWGPENSTLWIDLAESRRITRNSSRDNMGTLVPSSTATAAAANAAVGGMLTAAVITPPNVVATIPCRRSRLDVVLVASGVSDNDSVVLVANVWRWCPFWIAVKASVLEEEIMSNNNPDSRNGRDTSSDIMLMNGFHSVVY